MAMTLSGCLGENRILGGMAVSSRLREWDRGRHDGLPADHARGVSLPGGVVDEAGVAGTEDVLGAIAQADLEPARQDDDELTARRRMPVEESPDRPYAERDLRGRPPVEPVRLLGDVDRLDPPLP